MTQYTTPYCPARPGMNVAEVDTPALLVDLNAFEHNLALMQDFASATGMKLRPHAKTHKCAEIAHRQIAAGAVGICCQKLSEAERLAEAGIGNILISNEVVGAAKLARLPALAERCQLTICVDHLQQVEALAAVTRKSPQVLDVLVEIDVGSRRCGVKPGATAVQLAAAVAACPTLNFAGLQAYHGGAQHLRTPQERHEQIAGASRESQETITLLREAGLACSLVTGAGTGTFEFEATSGVYTELQAGSYVFLDRDYADNKLSADSPANGLRHSLFILTTVMSNNRPGQAVVDAGLKALSVDSGLPTVADRAGIQYAGASDEHGIVLFDRHGEVSLQLGEHLRLIPGHCDPTVNLYDWLVAYRGDTVEEVWQVTARGAVY